MKFGEISSTNELVKYLSSSSCQRKNFYHYTNFDNYMKILESGYLFLSSFIELNDAYEAHRIDLSIKKSTYIASFSRNESESIAMWAMYATPHSIGVRIEISSEVMKRWIKKIDHVREVINEQKSLSFLGSRTIPIQKASIHTITYFEPNKSKFYWSNQSLLINKNKDLANFENNISTHGFVKHAAWAYEEEMRVSVKVENALNLQKIAIPVPDFVLKDMKDMIGPAFDSNERIVNPNSISELFGKVTLRK